MSSGGQNMVLITSRLWVESLYGQFTEGLDSMILVGPLQLRAFCESVDDFAHKITHKPKKYVKNTNMNINYQLFLRILQNTKLLIFFILVPNSLFDLM